MKQGKALNIVIYLILIPLVIFASYYTWLGKRFNILALLLILIATWPFLRRFEKRVQTSRELVLLASFVTLTLIGRLIFFFLPGFNPVATIVIVGGIFFGSEFGFMVGFLSPFISNIFFTQGPWTPFQMFAYGFIGLIAGIPLISHYLKGKKSWLLVYGIFAGVSYSFVMDVWTVLSIDQFFTLKRYLLVLIPAIPYTITYVIGNVIFLLSFVPLIGDRLEKIKIDFQING